MKKLKAEFIKMRHTFLFPIHILIPIISCAVFLAWTRTDAQLQLSAYVQAVGIAFPLLSSVLCAGSVELEIPGNYQGMLTVPGKREGIFLAKIAALEILAFLAVIAAVLLYGMGNGIILKKPDIPFSLFLQSGLLLWLGSIPLYLEHLFLNLCFSKAVSLAFSIGQTLLSALFLTGLGDGRWQFIPGSWAARGVSLYLAEKFHRRADLGRPLISSGEILTCVLLGMILCVIIFLWFHFYEGKNQKD